MIIFIDGRHPGVDRQSWHTGGCVELQQFRNYLRFMSSLQLLALSAAVRPLPAPLRAYYSLFLPHICIQVRVMTNGMKTDVFRTKCRWSWNTGTQEATSGWIPPIVLELVIGACIFHTAKSFDLIKVKCLKPSAKKRERFHKSVVWQKSYQRTLHSSHWLTILRSQLEDSLLTHNPEVTVGKCVLFCT